MPEELTTIAAMQALLARAVDAHATGASAEAAQLARRFFEEATPQTLAPFVAELGQRWQASFPEDVSPMTTVIVESSLEEAVEALAAGQLDVAIAQLEEAFAYQPKAGTPEPGMGVFLAGARPEAPTEPMVEAEEAEEALPPESPPASEAAPEPEPEPEMTPAQTAPAAPVASPVPPPPAPTGDWVERGLETLGRDPAVALRCFERAIERTPHVVEAWQGRGRAQMVLGRFDEARQAFEHLLKLTPTDPRAWMAYAAALAKLGQTDAARRAQAQAVALEQSTARATAGV